MSFAARRPRRALFLIALAVALCIQPGDLGSSDASRRLQLAHSWWTDAPPVRADETSVVVGRDGVRYPFFGPGHSAVMLPADIAGTWLVRAAGYDETQGLGEKLRVAFIAYTTFPVIVALCVVLAYELLVSVGFTVRESALGALSLLVATRLLPYAQVHQENSLQLMLTLGALVGVARWTESRRPAMLALASACAGANFLVRPVTVIDTAAVLLFGAIALRGIPRPGGSELVAGLAPASIAFAIDRGYHHFRFGTWTGTYFGAWSEQARAADPSLPASYPFSLPFSEGFFGVFFSPARSVLAFDIALVVASCLVVLRWQSTSRRTIALFAAGAVMLTGTAAFYAKYVMWSGANAWGARYVTTGACILGMLAVPMLLRFWHSLRLPVTRAALATALAAAVALQAMSIVFWSDLEERQCFAMRSASCRVIAMRASNIAAFVKGELTPSDAISERVVTPNFMPFVAEAWLPERVALAIKILWALALLATVAMIARAAATWMRMPDSPAPTP